MVTFFLARQCTCNTFYVTFPSAHVLMLMSLTVIWARSEDIVSLREDICDKDNGLERKE